MIHLKLCGGIGLALLVCQLCESLEIWVLGGLVCLGMIWVYWEEGGKDGN
jgi:hypothetical protein